MRSPAAMTLSQRRRFMAAILVAITAVAALVALATRTGGSTGDSAALTAWFDDSGRQASSAAEQQFTALLAGLSRSKVDNGGPGILRDESICQAGAAVVRTYSQEPPPAGQLRHQYRVLMRTGQTVFTDCLHGIAEPVLSESKHDVNLMLAEMTTYSTVISDYERGVAAAKL